MRFACSLALALPLAAACTAEPAAEPRATPLAAAWLLSIEDTGTWTDAAHTDVVYAWVDVRVANVRYHKRVLIDVIAPYDDGVVMRTLLPAHYKAALGDGTERWGSDAVELYPQAGPGGRALAGPVAARARIQYDADGDGKDEMLATPWQALYGAGELVLPDRDPFAGLRSPVRPAGPESARVLFAPFDDPGRAVIDELDAITARQLANPDERHTIHAAVFNINDPEITARLIEAHQAGVEVRLVIDGRKFRPWYGWHTGDDQLLAAGVPVLGVKYPGTGAMHTKLALFDGERIATGSFNWEWGARHENHENMVVSADPELIAAYARRFEMLAGGVQLPRAHAIERLSFAPDEQPHRIAGELIDAATTELFVAMFTAKDIAYVEHGAPTSLLTKLAQAAARGVDVRVVVDHGIHEASEYHGIVTPDDPSDEWLEAQGVHVIRADNRFGPYASMHHKFVIADRQLVVTGAFNWYHDAAFVNDEDQLVVRDEHLVARFIGEANDLSRRYDPQYDPADWPHVELEIAAHHAGTHWGDGLRLVGELPALGGWSPASGVVLDPAGWPAWRATVTLPIGTRFSYKLVVVDAAGRAHWQPGPNRDFTVPTEAGTLRCAW